MKRLCVLILALAILGMTVQAQTPEGPEYPCPN